MPGICFITRGKEVDVKMKQAGRELVTAEAK